MLHLQLLVPQQWVALKIPKVMCCGNHSEIWMGWWNERQYPHHGDSRVQSPYVEVFHHFGRYLS